MTHVATAPDAAAFAPFGTIIDAPRRPGDRNMFGDWLRPVDGLALQFHINAVAPSAEPVNLTLIERHRHAAQVFVPMDVSRYLVTVVRARADGAPDLTGVVCMELPGTLGVIYHPGVWHAGVTVLDRTGHFAVLMYRGAGDDDEFRAIDPITIRTTSSKVQA